MTPDDSVSQFFSAGRPAERMASYNFCLTTEMPSHGIFHLVRAQRYGRWWVLKTLRPEYRGQDMYEQMLRKEFEIAISLRHEGIVETVGFEDVPGVGYSIVMEWVDGETLHSKLSSGEMPKAQRMSVLHQLLDAVEYMHTRQVVHRDIKPQNILITRSGTRVKLIDFSLSDTESYAVLKHSAGSIGYVSPEQQADGAQADVRNDIYSLGCVMRDLQLGWAVKSVVRCCLSAIERRPASVAELRRKLHNAILVPRITIATSLIVTVCLTIPPIVERFSAPPTGEAQVFNDKIQIDNIYYWINNMQRHTLDVRGAIPDEHGRVVFPDHVMYGGERYTVQYMGDYSLERAGISDISLPPTLEVVGLFSLFANNFRSIVFPESTYSLLRGALSDCRQLESIELGSQVKVIDLDALSGCTSLRRIILRTPEPPCLGSQSNIDFPNIVLYVPAEAVAVYRNAERWREFGTIAACPF